MERSCAGSACPGLAPVRPEPSAIELTFRYHRQCPEPHHSAGSFQGPPTSVERYRLISSAVTKPAVTGKSYLQGNGPDIHILGSQAQDRLGVMLLLIWRAR
jgi:hypothetical protein